MMKKEVSGFAPCVIITYNRLEHTQKVISALKNNRLAKDTDVYVFSDNGKNDEDKRMVDEVRKYLSTVIGFNKFEIIKRETNYGLARNIISAVSEVIDIYGKAIVLEDDICVAEFFLEYMNNALAVYEEQKNVMSISGYSFPMKKTGLKETYFLKMGECWGWATWKDRWELFDKNPEKLIKLFSKNDIYHFNLENRYDYWAQVLGNYANKINTWAVFWYATIYQNGGLTLYPRNSLVQNIGFDGTGTNTDAWDGYLVDVSDQGISFFEEDIRENKRARHYLKRYYDKQNSFIDNVIRTLSWIRSRNE